MAISDTITSMYTNVGNAYNVLTLAGADLTSINKNLVNLTPTWKERLLYFMNNETQEVWNNWTKVNGTGTTLTLNNTEEAPMSLTYKGNTLQNGTPTPSSPIPVQVVSGDNSIEVVGKNLCSQATYLSTKNRYYPVIQASYSVEENQRYAISFDTENTGQPCYVNYSTATLLTRVGDYPSFTCDGTRKTFIATGTSTGNVSNTTLVARGGQVDVGDIETGYCSNLMIEKIPSTSSTATTYEQYKGASYPISLGVENLIDLNHIQPQNSYATVSLIENGVRIKTVSGGYAGRIVIDNLKQNTDYYLSYNWKNISNGENKVYVFAGTTASTILTSFTGTNSTGGTFNTSANSTINIWFYAKTNEAGEVEYTNIQLEKGTTKHSYTPSWKTPIELNKIGTYQDKIDKSSGKNLFDGEIELGNINPANGELSSSTTRTRSKNFIEVQPNKTYVLTRKVGANRWIVGYTANKVGITDGTISGYPSALGSVGAGNNIITFTTTATTKYIKWYDTDSTDLTEQVMINEGTTALEYEPYGTNWYLKKEIGKVVLDGSESWQEGADTGRYNLSVPNIILGSASNNPILSDRFQQRFATSNYSIFSSGSNHLMCIIYQDIPFGYANFKTWLSNNNTIVYYAMTTPTYETITDTTLLSQLEEAKKSYESQTNISQENNDLPFELDVVALGVM